MMHADVSPLHVRLAILGASPCPRCTAQCCRQTVTAYAVRLQDDDERRRFAPWAITLMLSNAAGEVVGERVITYRDGRCPFLGEDDRCTIYDDRPQACRDFECAGQFNQFGIGRHGFFVERNDAVRAMLEGL